MVTSLALGLILCHAEAVSLASLIRLKVRTSSPLAMVRQEPCETVFLFVGIAVCFGAAWAKVFLFGCASFSGLAAASPECGTCFLRSFRGGLLHRSDQSKFGVGIHCTSGSRADLATGFAKRLAFSARRKCWTFEGRKRINIEQVPGGDSVCL